jgi:WD40 repeat protein
LPGARPRARSGLFPNRTALDEALQGGASPQAAAYELLGERQLWWKCCSEAVRNDPSWFFDGRGEKLRAWLNATVPDHAAGSATTADHAWQLGRALAASADQEGEHAKALARLAQAWERGKLVSSNAAPGPAQPSGRGLETLSPRVAGGLKSVVERIQLRHDTAAENHGTAAEDGEPTGPMSVLVIAALLMAGVEPRRRPVVSVPVVFGRSAGPTGRASAQEGVTGVLELREFPAGPAGLYPDPRAMPGVRSPNGQFAASLGHAWNAAGPRRAGRCVLWRLVLSGDPVPPARIEGPSLGAAFALGLRELLRYPPAGRPSVAWMRSAFHGLRPRTAVTGGLDGGERLVGIADMDAKLLAARRKGLRLVAPQANRLDVAAAPEPGEVRFAANLRQADRYARRIRAGRLAVAVLVLIATVTGVSALQQRGSAHAEQRAALAGQVTAEANQLRGTDPSLAAQLDLVAYRMMPRSDPYRYLIAAGNAALSTPLQAHRLLVNSVAYRQDGRILASASDEGTIKLWSLADPGRPTLLGQPLPTTIVSFDAVFSPDGRTLASGGYDGKIRMWNVADPAHPKDLGQPLNAHGAATQSVAFSPDGRTLATGGNDHTIRLWNLTDPAHPTALLSRSLTGKTGFVVSLAFSPDGRTLAASANDFTVRLWDLANPSHAPVLLKPPNPANNVYNLAFSPDGHTLATANDGRVWLWNISAPAHPSLLSHYLNESGSVDSMAFSPDGQTLAIGKNDHVIRLWNVANPAAPVALPHILTAASGVFSVAFSPDGQTLASGSSDGRIRMWNLPNWHLPGLVSGTEGLAFSPDGRILATGDVDGMLNLWNVTDRAGPKVLSHTKTGKSPVYNLAFSPNGRTLAAGAVDGTVSRWNITDPANPEAVGRPLSAATNGAQLALSLDGRTLAAANGEHTIKIWSLADPAHPTASGRPLTDTDLIGSFAVSPDGRALATFNGGTIKLWNAAKSIRPTDLANLGAPQSLSEPLAFSRDGHILAAVNGAETGLWSLADPARPATLGTSVVSSKVFSLAFSPHEPVLAAGSEDGTIRFIDPDHPTAPSQPLADHAGSVFSLAFSPDGHTLASTATDRTVRLWNTDPHDAARRICAATGNLTTAQWQKYVPGAPYEPPCR